MKGALLIAAAVAVAVEIRHRQDAWNMREQFAWLNYEGMSRVNAMRLTRDHDFEAFDAEQKRITDRYFEVYK